MADRIDPTGNKNIAQNFLPNYYKTEANKKFLQSTIEQLIQPGTVKKVNGYVGRKNAKSVVKSDVFVDAASKMRSDYQLEPGITVTDTLDNVTFFKDYQDFINQLSVFGANTSNHARLNSQEFYSWDPHIDWDKFVNFQNYYWLPNGPDDVKIYGQSTNIESSYSVTIKNNGDNNTYIFTPNGLTENPVLTFYRGQTYTFQVDSPGNPFSIKSDRVLVAHDLSGPPVESGSLTFTVPYNAPNVLYYQSSTDLDLGGVIHVLDVTENSSINVDEEIIGKSQYQTSSGFMLSNGMKVSFGGKVFPETYKNRFFYVEGVGSHIQLIDEKDLELISPYTTSDSILFDVFPFDKQPFSDATSYAGIPDYIVINRASIDKNPWTRYNRWFHKDVIEQSAVINKSVVNLDQTFRATRPIIEFEPNLKLLNFGTTAINDVDLIDTYTVDAFSDVEGAFGYNIDGIDVANGHKIIFAADTDSMVKNKIYQVEMIDVIHSTQTNKLSTTATQTAVQGNTITVASTKNMEVGNPIRFSGTALGNIVPNKTYYILSILNSTTITISGSIKGTIVQQQNASGLMNVFSVYDSTSKQIHLVEVITPVENHVSLIHAGVKNQGLSYWFDGSNWKLGQQKTSLNQAPLFDIFDNNGNSYHDIAVYPGSTFSGTKLFSYKIGSGSNDSVLGFPLSYKTINNVGDIVFNFNIESDSFKYEELNVERSKNTNVGFLLKTSFTGEIGYVNGWQKNESAYTQAAVRVYKDSTEVNNFILDIYDDLTQLDDLQIKVYVNGKRLDSSLWYIATETSADISAIPIKKIIILETDIGLNDVLTVRTFSEQPINNNGHYEIPINLQNNPLNGTINDFTLGEVIDHVSTIVDSVDLNFSGAYPGASNLRDLGNITKYGVRFVQHSSPASLPLYHITSETNNIIRAVEQAREDYNVFKKNFLTVATTLGIDADPITQVNLILEEINKNKPKESPYYFSDMVPFGASQISKFTVVDYRNTFYPLTNVFTLDTLSNKAVGVYQNGTQLVHGKHYTFNDQGFVVIISKLTNGDELVIYEYESTDGCFVPPTPTKFGIWPSYRPKVYTDTSYVTPQKMIQGHDGSKILAFNDYRDTLILELEKRIYNNIKSKYDTSIFDITDIIPSYNRKTEYSLDEFNGVLAPHFYKWSNIIGRDFTKPLTYDENNSFTFNYRGHAAPDGRDVPGYWRGVYKWLLDTDQPNVSPWEMLGFTEMPDWWDTVYGPGPYTSDNLVLWADLSEGIVRQPNKPIVKLNKYAKPFLKTHVPVDNQGKLISPLESGLATGIITRTVEHDFVFGDISPVELAWRRSSYYPFSVLITAMLLSPSKTFGLLLDRARIIRNLTGQLVYKDTGLRVKPADIQLPSIYSSSTRVQTAGIINYIVDYILSDNLRSYTQYNYDLKNLKSQLGYRLGAFTSKEKFNLLLDSKNPAASGNVFVPQENYKVVINRSSPTKKISYSGVIVTKLQTGFEIKGYNITTPYFTRYLPFEYTTGTRVNVGGISESYTKWTPNQKYYEQKIVLFEQRYYRVNVTHTTTDEFEPKYYTVLPSLPIIGGINSLFKRNWNKTKPVDVVPYGTIFYEIQDVVDFLLGYGEWLSDQGFVFDEFNTNTSSINNWDTSAKEFLFWTTQNWSVGQDKWDEWNQESVIPFGSIVRYNGDYYRAIKTIQPSTIFEFDSYVKLDGLSTIGSAVISLSPAAEKITFNVSLNVVDDIRNPFNGYEIFKVDGNPIPPKFINSYREGNLVSYSPRSNDGIYSATFFLVQDEHVVVIDNTTMFNDTIYSPETGYKQDRIKVSGYVSSNWNGSLNVPGFIFDRAKIEEWEPWTPYALGDTVKYKEYYYSALSSISGDSTFNSLEWTKLTEKPTPSLLPNWTYKASQFTDFYDLDSDNFDIGQQKMAQHLIGYQKRQYLSNIIQDDVSEYKFYQGMIAEKGTHNVLNKLFDVLSSEDLESLKFYEEWALRVGQYGASSAFDTIEFVLDESLFKINPQGFELVNVYNESKTDYIIRQTPSDVYLTPPGYKSQPWSTLPIDNEFLRSAGYVRSDEVFLSLKTLDDILNYTIETPEFVDGCYVWCTFDSVRWNVYRFTNIDVKVESIVFNDGALTITLDKLINLDAGSYVGIDETSGLNGFYKVLSRSLNVVVLDAPNLTFSGPFNEQNSIILYGFYTQRAVSINSIDSILPKNLKYNELVWTDNDGTGKPACWQYRPVYNKDNNNDPITVVSPFSTEDLFYGRDFVIDESESLMAVSTGFGKIIVLDKVSPDGNWIQRQEILTPFICNDEYGRPLNLESTIASVVAMSADRTWLATGSPEVGNVATKFMGEYSPNVEYLEGSIVILNSIYYRAVIDVPRFTPPIVNITHWKQAFYIPVDDAGTPSSLVSQGAISIYKKDANNIYDLVDTIISPVPVAGEKFGSVLTFGENELFVTAIGSDNIGTVYNLQYGDTTQATAIYNPNGSENTTLKVSNTRGIEAGMIVVGVGFTSRQTVIDVIDDTTLILSSAPTVQPSGTIEFKTVSWKYNLSFVKSGVELNEFFGTDIVISKDFSTLVISSPSIEGYIKIYKNINGVFTFLQQLNGSRIYPYFGKGLAVSDNGDYIAASDVKATNTYSAEGIVYIYNYDSTTSRYYRIQQIVNKHPEPSQEFGRKLLFSNNSNTLVIFSSNSDSFVNLTFDKNSTTFDDSSTVVGSIYVDSGRVDVYDRYDTSWVYSESLKTTNAERDGYGKVIRVSNNSIFVSAPYLSSIGKPNEGRIYQYSRYLGDLSWTVYHTTIPKPDVSQVKHAFLYNKSTNRLIKYLDVIDPLQGKIAGIADSELKYKTFYDPAIYSVGTVDVNVDEGIAWTTMQVGALWWDLRTTKFVNSYDSDVVYRNSLWNTLATGATVDIYEWVETTLSPDEWDNVADTEIGLADGISGTSLYGNDVYSIRRRYDNIARTFRNTYYYWVKNKKTVPNITGRKLSAQSVSNLIGNPRGEGYQYLALTGLDSFSLVNVKNLLSSTDVVLAVEFWINNKPTRNIHTQWKLISNQVSTSLPKLIEEKWVDSLCGKDLYGRQVPDINVPIKLRYGVENRPIQSMFVNRIEALKQVIEQANLVLKTNLISDTRDLTSLLSIDQEPNEIKGLYDVVRDTDAELKFETLKLFEKPVLTPKILDGRIVGVNIDTPGRGYATAPFIEVLGSGSGAVIRSTIDKLGRFNGAEILSAGEGYDDNTSLVVRSYSVLVRSDSQANGVWSIYSYDKPTQIWSRTLSQTYNTTKYWNYIDWYSTDVSEFSVIKYAVDTYADLKDVNATVGDLVKVRTDNLGAWTLMKKYADSTSYDWTMSYRVVGKQNGTIQLSSLLYDFDKTIIGFDGLLYDGGIFDNSASIELRNILIAIKDNIFVDDLKSEYLNLFFTSVRYALSEQTYLDWIFKTSFVKAQHNVGNLKQPVTYKNDNLQNFEDYVAEVKPYRTQIREYVSAYNAIDLSSTAITDFDLPPIDNNNIISAVVKGDSFDISNTEIQSYPWKFWLDNVGFSVVAIKILDGGQHYINRPVVKIVGRCNTQATATAYIASGKLNRIVITNPGSGYLSAPMIQIEGGLGIDGVAANAITIIGNSVVRTNLVNLKFDRLSNTPVIAQLDETETFIGSTRVQFPLIWAPDVRVGQSLVTVNGIEVLRETYSLKTVKSIVNGETRYSGTITFDTAPKAGGTIIVNYKKDPALLTAADRIRFYYNPITGQAGNDLSQLITGVDYGGVNVTGLGFDTSGGYGATPYSSEAWDNFDERFDDYRVTVSENVHSLILPYVPSNSTELNIYHSRSVVSTFTSDGNQLEFSYNGYMESPIVFITKIISAIVSGSVEINNAGNDIISVDSTLNIQIGDTITDNSNYGDAGRTLITSVDHITNNLIVNSSSNLTQGMPIYIYGPSLGGIVEGLYYVKTVIDGTHITISQTVGGATVDVTSTETGIQTIVYGIFNSNTIVTEIINSTQLRLNQPIYSNLIVGTEIKILRKISKFNGISRITNRSLKLSSPIPVGMNLEVIGNLETVRLDDPNFGTPDQTNENAIMSTIIADGIQNEIQIPLTYTINNGDTLIVRKSTSDGSINPVETEYDTSLSGGDLAYLTAGGIAAEDIIVDGDGFVTPTSSPATEEVVPGQIVDAVAIKVYDRNLTVSANICVDNFIFDGITNQFIVSVQLNSDQATLVKVNDGISSVLLDSDQYTVDIRTNTVTLVDQPAVNSIISIFAIGINGYGIIDINSIISNGNDLEFITEAKYVSTIGLVVYVDGILTEAEIYEIDHIVAFRLSEAPPLDSLITYAVSNVAHQTISVTRNETIITNGSPTYLLSYPPGDILPNETNMIIKLGNQILPGPKNSYFVIGSNRLNYTINPSIAEPYSVNISDITVYVDGIELVKGTDYIVDLGGISVKINNNTYKKYKGRELNVTISGSYAYSVLNSSPVITMFDNYEVGNRLEVITSYNHNSLNIHRSRVDILENKLEYFSYAGDFSDSLTLPRSIENDNYVWITKNGNLLVPSVDYKLNDDRQSVTLLVERLITDKFELITFDSNLESRTISYMQFKDMLNRVHYKRLNKNKCTELAVDLNFNDTTIEVVNGNVLERPQPLRNRPGIIEIRGERIEYFKIDGNVISQIRRGTLGTGCPAIHKAGATIYDLGSTETLPYKDTTLVSQVESDGTHIVDIDFIPTKVTGNWTYATGFTSEIPQFYDQSDDIEVFVGGYDTSTVWAPLASYQTGDIVTVGSYTYQCIATHTSTELFKNDSENWKFFVGNIRLKKKPYSVHNCNQHPYSPLGDVQFDADFSVDGYSKQVRLTNLLSPGTKVTVVKRTGINWDGITDIRTDNSSVSEFIRSVPGVWYSIIKQ